MYTSAQAPMRLSIPMCQRAPVYVYTYVRNNFLTSSELHPASNFYVGLLTYMHPLMRACCLYVCQGTHASVRLYACIYVG